jgi:UDP-GlcNAc:undecaprenyl-phosphate GlcNAc-1-phosphate transferase
VIALAFLVAGAVVAAAATRALEPVLAHPVLARENYRGAALPTSAGLCLVLAVVVVEGVRSTIDPTLTADRVLVLLAVLAFGLLGLVDDILGDAGDRGLRGHLRAAARGRVTTGFLKLAGGALVALVIAAAASGGSVARTIVDGALIALAANLGNLFDRAPGRTIKWGIVAYVPLAIVAGADGTAVAVVAGASLGLLVGDLRERFMLGDAGANAIGAALGVQAVLVLGPGARVVTAVVLLALNLASELISFSRVIAAVPPLRAFDRLGRLAMAVAVIVAVVVSGAPQAGAQDDERGRVLVVSLPGLTWSEVETLQPPALLEFLTEASVADLAPRSVRHSSRPGDAYLTISGGSRAIGDPLVDGEVLPPDADYAGEPAGGVFERRTGDAAGDSAAVALPWPSPASVRWGWRSPTAPAGWPAVM